MDGVRSHSVTATGWTGPQDGQSSQHQEPAGPGTSRGRAKEGPVTTVDKNVSEAGALMAVPLGHRETELREMMKT